MIRDTLIQMAAVGVVAGGIAGGMIILVNTGFQSEDVLAFAGTVVGSAATVASAVWISDRSFSRERRGEQSAIREELEALHTVATLAAASNPKGGVWSDAWRSNLGALIDVAQGCGRFLDEVIAMAKTLNFHEREAVKQVREAICRFVMFYDDVMNIEGELPPEDERTWTSEIQLLGTETKSALAVLKRR